MYLRFISQSARISLAFFLCLNVLRAETPLHQRIDALIGFGEPEFEKTASDEAEDAAFLRRVYLDLVGSIPSTTAVREFLADTACDKRAKLIDRLLASPQHARRMQYVFDTTLMERRADKHVKQAEWRGYLRQSFLENKPWDQLVTEILTSDGSDKSTRPAAKFLLDRELKEDDVTRDLGRIFLGRDLQCAQCHDHPTIDDYLQRHYHGLSAFLNRSYLFKDPKAKLSSIGEKAEGDVEFTSVFTNETDRTAPRMLDLPAIEDPPTAEEPYKVKPEKNARAVPVHSRRLQLAAAMTDPSNAAFRLNIANRLWAMMMGRGIVEPVDMWHSANPPSHPELLNLLGDALQDHGYDLRFLLRELALSKTYQRSSQRKEGMETEVRHDFGVALLKPLSPEQMAWSMMQATGLAEQTLESLKAKQIKADPKKGAEQANDPAWQEKTLHDALKANVDIFETTFGVVGIQTSRFDASADQALFLRNGNLLQTWLAPAGKKLAQRLTALENSQVAEELYFSVFSRPPLDEETQQITDYLAASQDNRNAAIGQLIWAALASAEFRFNH